MVANLGFHASTYKVWTTLHSITNGSIEERTVQELPFEWCYFLRFIEVKCHGKAPGKGEGGTPYDGLYGKALPERGIFFSLQVYERVEKSVICVCKRAKRAYRRLLRLDKVEKTFYFCD